MSAQRLALTWNVSSWPLYNSSNLRQVENMLEGLLTSYLMPTTHVQSTNTSFLQGKKFVFRKAPGRLRHKAQHTPCLGPTELWGAHESACILLKAEEHNPAWRQSHNITVNMQYFFNFSVFLMEGGHISLKILGLLRVKEVPSPPQRRWNEA